MKSVTAPSFAFESRRNRSTSGVRSTKPLPRVCTASCDVTMLAAATMEAFALEVVPDRVTPAQIFPPPERSFCIWFAISTNRFQARCSTDMTRSTS